LRVKDSAPDDRLIFMGFVYTTIWYNRETISKPALYLGMMERRISPPVKQDGVVDPCFLVYENPD